MPPAHVDAVVRVKEDIRALQLKRGDQGVVLSIWLSPGDFLYEVEFPRPGASRSLRTLLPNGQLEVVKSPAGGAS